MPVPQDPTQTLPRSLLRDGVYLRLRDAIVDGTLTPGEQLRDGELAAWLGVSRTPVREALLRLGQVGLVTTSPGRSTTVAPLDPDAVRQAGSVVAAMHRLAVLEAGDRLTGEDLDAMRAANQRFAEALEQGDADAALAADDDFHAVLVRVAGNHALDTVLEQFSPVLRRVERLRFSTESGRLSVARHAHLLELLAAGNARAAAEAAHEIWESLDPLVDALAGTAVPLLKEEA
jgi:DNA-binding GntR family transcriptional regulator